MTVLIQRKNTQRNTYENINKKFLFLNLLKVRYLGGLKMVGQVGLEPTTTPL